MWELEEDFAKVVFNMASLYFSLHDVADKAAAFLYYIVHSLVGSLF